MPLQKCTANGKNGWRWGDEGKCYTGPNAKSQAMKQGRAIEAGTHNLCLHNECFCSLSTNFSSYQTRLEKFQGRDHIVVPAVMLTEGVHNGSAGPLYYPAEEINKYPSAWNGRPIPVFHPEDDNGFPISCNSPDVLEAQNVGQIFTARSARGKLSAQLWIDIERLSAVDPALLERINNKEPIEVSTGLFMLVDDEQGEWNGEEYVGIARDYRPDHLALLPTGKGACSVSDGCGLRTNAASSKEEITQELDKLTIMEELSFDKVSDMVRLHVRGMNTQGSGLEMRGPYHWAVEIWANYFIYEKESTEDGHTEHFKQGYKLNEDQTGIELVGDPIPGRFERKFMEINNQQGGIDVNKKQMIEFLTANGCTLGTDLLEATDEKVLSSMVDQVKQNQDAATALEESKTKLTETETKLAAANADTQPPATLDDYIASAPAEMQGVLNRAVNRDRQAKTELVEQLAANQDAFTKEELAGWGLEQLEKFARAVPPKGDYVVLGARPTGKPPEEETPMEVPTFNFGNA